MIILNVMEAYRRGEKTYEFKGTNGFMLTLDIDSKTTRRRQDRGTSQRLRPRTRFLQIQRAYIGAVTGGADP